MKSFSIFVVSGFLLAACSEKEKPQDQAPVARIHITQNATAFTFDGTGSTDPEGKPLTYEWSSESNVITITSPHNIQASCPVPALATPTHITIYLKVSDGLLASTASQTILVPSTNMAASYGLGQTMTMSASNDAGHEWYIDQAGTGTYAGVNCGPTSTTMAIRWANENFAKTPQDARNMYRSEGGWWYTNDVINYLNYYSISNETIQLDNIGLLRDEVDKGNVVILCLDMYYVDAQSEDSYHVSKFYNASTVGWGHFIVIKGYAVVDNQTFFQAYDPYDFGKVYLDNSPKGKDRYYKASNLDAATNKWWDFAIVVSGPKSGGRQAANPYAVDPQLIVHQRGQ